MSGPLCTLDEAQEALADALERVDPDNPIAATRAVASVARRFRTEVLMIREALRGGVEQKVWPHFRIRSMDPGKAAAWAVCAPNVGKLDRGRGECAALPTGAASRRRNAVSKCGWRTVSGAARRSVDGGRGK